MSSILYYSNFCEHSKKLLAHFSKTKLSKEIHFISIDNRVKDPSGKIYIILPNNQKIIMARKYNKSSSITIIKSKL